ncbi:ATP-binding domain-containing protein [Rhodococcus hoagii]|nr:ATP-binding domain-containing protein [Prescottella equi]NKR71630.1 ATP-binding domain-containing protein [Prescottella equi]
MIPACFPQDAPPGEKSVYQALASSTETDDWLVLHSVGISDHVKNPEGEADFVVIAPHLGVLIIEVKSHDYVDFRNGVWHLGSQKPTARGPFKQASEAKHSIRAFLLKKKVELRYLPVISAAWFTAVRARTTLPSSSEWHDWEVLDSEDLKNDPIGAIRRTFKAGTAHLDDTFPGFSYGGVGPDEATAQRIALALRPNFEIGVVAGDLRHARASQLVRFVEEQYMALDAMADNPAVLFTGPAGSGKTFLAMEAARREIEIGNQGRLICFNRFLGQRLVTDMPEDPRLTVGTLHSQMLTLAGVSAPREPSSVFWAEELPERALEALIDMGDSARCDFLVVDEIQDVLSEPYIDVLDFMVKGGLTSGRVLMFGDFERQAIYDDGDGLERLKARLPHLPSSKLVMNCRNLPRIGHSVNHLSRLRPGYQKFRREDDGTNPVWLKYRRGEDQSMHLRQAVQALRNESYDLSEIVVLSPLGSTSVAATTSDTWLQQVLKPADGRPRRKGELQYSTIHAYKGLDAPAVIVTDLDRDSVPNFESVLYVGLTRATDRLYGVLEERTGLASVEGKL